jgi:hypothetical protein
MANVEDNCTLIRALLYDRYNKDKFEDYTAITENLIIIENFLRKSNFLITNAVQKSSSPFVSENLNVEEITSNAKIIENLKKQIKPRERKVLFPEVI